MTNILAKRAALLAFVAFAIPAGAKPGVEQVQVRIDYADINIHTSAGADALRERIRKGIRETCSTTGYRTLGDMRREGECRRSLAANAELRLAALIAGEGGVRVAGR